MSTTTHYTDELVEQGKQVTVKVIKDAMATVHGIAPEVHSALGAVDPRGLVNSAFGAAGKLLESQRTLVHDILGAVFDKPTQAA